VLDDDGVGAGVRERALPDHAAERLDGGGVVAVPGVEVDEDIVRLGRAVQRRRGEGREGVERRVAVPRGGEEAEARERRRGQREGGEEGAQVGDRGEGDEAGREGVVERERRLRREGSEEGERGGRRGRGADGVEHDDGVVGRRRGSGRGGR
jgi:hypothetical protein